MVNVYSKAFDRSIQIDRIIGHIKGEQPGPTIVFIAGIHGNEPSGVFALNTILEEINSNNIAVNGNIYAIAGNLAALKKGVRYFSEDLNRMWTEERMEKFNTAQSSKNSSELEEQDQIYQTITDILKKETEPFYFIDLHTTSSHTEPFITVNDNLLNRKFTQQYPVPLLLGIEEYLDGTLLNHINNLGYVAFGFESGQHDALSSIKHHIAFVYLSLVFSGCISESSINYSAYYEMLTEAKGDLANIYEIIFHYKIQNDEIFKMKPGLLNFAQVHKGKEIASSNDVPVLVHENGNIFMPLYQKQGEDGFFIIKKVNAVFLKLSTFFREIHMDYLLPLLPGIHWVSKTRDALKVNLKIARFFAKKLFHLMGYRSKQVNDKYMIIRNREARARKNDYLDAAWYKK